MTIEKVIDRADRLRPNQFSNTEKVLWLSELDNQVYQEVLLMAEENWKYKTFVENIEDEEGHIIETKEVVDFNTVVPAFEFEGYDETTPLDTPLLIDDMYANTYVDYLISKYDYANREYGAYNNSALVFNSQYQNYTTWYRRTHKPRARKVQGI